MISAATSKNFERPPLVVRPTVRSMDSKFQESGADQRPHFLLIDLDNAIGRYHDLSAGYSIRVRDACGSQQSERGLTRSELSGFEAVVFEDSVAGLTLFHPAQGLGRRIFLILIFRVAQRH